MDLTPEIRSRSFDRSRLSLNRTQLDSFLSPERTQNQSFQGSIFHFLEENDVLIDVSRAIFEEFKNWSAENHDYRSTTELYYQTAENSVQIIQRLVQGQRKVDQRLRKVLDQLTKEKNALSLILKLIDTDRLIEMQKDTQPTSYLKKIFIENEQFRRLTTLLHWSEEIAFENPIGFSQMSKEYNEFDNVKNIYSQTALHGNFVHFDFRFGDQKISEEDVKSVKRLNSIVFSLIRCGRLKEVKDLVSRVGLPVIGAFLILREFLSKPELTPTDPMDEYYGLPESRMFFKKNARDLVQLPDDKIMSHDVCIWSTLSGYLEPLISFSSNTNDRLWSYLTCAVDSILDEQLIKFYDIQNSEIVDFNKENNEIPKDIESIFSEIHYSDSCPYFNIYFYLATNNMKEAVNFMRNNIRHDEEPQPHKIRFFAHLVILLKRENFEYNVEFADEIILHYVDILIDLKLYLLVPFYLSLISPEMGEQKIVDFFYDIQHGEQCQEILQQASEVGFDTKDLCIQLYEKAKRINTISTDQAKTRQSFHNLLGCWKWISFEQENIFRSIIEANTLLRKMMYYDHMAKAFEFLKSLPDLISQVEDTYQREFGDEKPEIITDALKEYTSYIMYFEAIENYNDWLRHTQSPVPEFPAKIPDETWARMDIRRRAEYDLNVQQTRDSIQKHLFLQDSLKNAAVESFENILAKVNEWLISRLPDDQDRDRISELVEIHERYLFVLVKTLISLHYESEDHDKVLEVAQRLVDPQHDLYNHFSLLNLKKLLELISKSGAALIEAR